MTAEQALISYNNGVEHFEEFSDEHVETEVQTYLLTVDGIYANEKYARPIYVKYLFHYDINLIL